MTADECLARLDWPLFVHDMHRLTDIDWDDLAALDRGPVVTAPGGQATPTGLACRVGRVGGPVRSVRTTWPLAVGRDVQMQADRIDGAGGAAWTAPRRSCSPRSPHAGGPLGRSGGASTTPWTARATPSTTCGSAWSRPERRIKRPGGPMSYEAETRRLGDLRATGSGSRSWEEQIASLDEDIGLIVANLALVRGAASRSWEKRADSHVTHMNDLRKWVDKARFGEGGVVTKPGPTRASSAERPSCGTKPERGPSSSPAATSGAPGSTRPSGGSSVPPSAPTATSSASRRRRRWRSSGRRRTSTGPTSRTASPADRLEP